MNFYKNLKQNFNSLDNVIINNLDDIKYSTIKENNYEAFNIYRQDQNIQNIQTNFNSTNEYPHYNIFGDWGKSSPSLQSYNNQTDRLNNLYSNLSKSDIDYLLKNKNGLNYNDVYNILQQNPQYFQNEEASYQKIYNDIINQRNNYQQSLNTRTNTITRYNNITNKYGDWQYIIKNSLV
jgi:hypothetical protein